MEISVNKSLTSAEKKARAAVRDMTSVYRDFKNRHCGKDALLVRKKFAVKDVCYRKSQPDAELFRFELAFDAEMYMLLLLAAGIGVWLTWRLARHRRKKHIPSEK